MITAKPAGFAARERLNCRSAEPKTVGSVAGVKQNMLHTVTGPVKRYQLPLPGQTLAC